MKQGSYQRVVSFLGVLLIASGFIGLGVWQLHRAQDSRKPVVVSSVVVPLQSVTQPRISLPSKAALRHVKVRGKYIADFQAPMQADGKGRVATWEVGLLATDPDAAILVVRGLWSDRELNALQESVDVTGKLMPHQNDDLANGSATVLSRIDSSLIVGQTSLNLYDGYVIADNESVNGTKVARSRVAPPTPHSAVPGFYWQHLSYVVIWWFMAGVVLYLPFYQRRVTPDQK